MSTAPIWMPLYIGDYLRDTARLTTEQHGAYLLLIMDYWTNGPLPDDDAALAQVARMTRDDWDKTRPAISRLFQISLGEWRHKRIDDELEKARQFFAKQKANGMKGGRPRKNPNETQTITQTKPKTNPDHNPNETNGFCLGLEWVNQEHIPKIAIDHDDGHHIADYPGNYPENEVSKTQTKPKQNPNHNPNHNPNETQTKANHNHNHSSTSITEIGVEIGCIQDRRDGDTAEQLPQPATRVGMLCKRLRQMGIVAAPHMLAWDDLLARFTDEEIIAVAEIAKDKKPGERLHLNYMVSMLNNQSAANPAAVGPRKPSSHSGFDEIDYREGVTADGRF